MKKFCESLTDHATKIISKRKKMKSLTKKNSRNYMNMQNFAIFVKESLKINKSEKKNIAKLEIIVIIKVTTEVLHIVYVI